MSNLKKKIHNFKWSKAFIDSYNVNLTKLLEYLTTQTQEKLQIQSVNHEKLDDIHNTLCKTLLKAARLAEREKDMQNEGKKKFKLRLNRACP